MHSIGLLLEQPIKKRKFDGDKDDENCRNQQRSVTVRLFSEAGKELSEAPVVVLASTTAEQLQSLYHQLLRNQKQPKDTNAGEEEDDDELAAPVQFRTAAEEPNGRNWTEIVDSLLDSLPPEQLFVEKPLELVCLPQAVFRVRPVTRCAASLPGHGEPVLSVQFSPDGSCLASGSGDRTVRLWDLHTNLPKQTLSGHSDWVLCIGWSPDGRALASACKSGVVRVWDARSGAQRRVLNGHQKWVNAIAWQPLHVASDAECRLLASAGWDKTIRIWDIQLGATVRVLSGHNASVTAIRWGGCGLIYSGSQDRTVKVWRADDGTLCRTLTGHGHWINTLSLSCDYVLRLGFFSAEAQSKGQPVLSPSNESLPQKLTSDAKRRYLKALGDPSVERLVSGSDDFTMFLWEPGEKKQPIARLTGHQQLVNQVQFSPDTRTIASASFDKSIKLWDGRTGKFIATLRGHVAPVYQIAWSSDGRLLVSGSADSTLKVWNIRTTKLMLDLPGHGDEVFAVDWSPNGENVASGGKDKLLKLWKR
uniref:WD_REPEATS_REGION domain-containing protein n=1 Tax=Globodera pallida TaxID=36090 RepID=A0A183CAW9_GLOPA